MSKTQPDPYFTIPLSYQVPFGFFRVEWVPISLSKLVMVAVRVF